MLGVAWAFVSLLSSIQVSGAAYADNWSWDTDTPSQHEPALEQLLHLVTSMKLEIDWGKTWCWATSPAHQRALHKLRQQPAARSSGFSRVACAKDSGAIIHNTRQHKLGDYKERLAKAHARLKRLAPSMLHAADKGRIVTQAVYPVAFHAAELFALGSRRTDEVIRKMSCHFWLACSWDLICWILSSFLHCSPSGLQGPSS